MIPGNEIILESRKRKRRILVASLLVLAGIVGLGAAFLLRRDKEPVARAKGPPAVDIVFVLDVTGDMALSIFEVRDGIDGFLKVLREAKLEPRVGLVAFRDITDAGAEPLKVLQFGGDPFTSDAMAFRAEVSRLVSDQGGDRPESSYEGIVEACKQPFRVDVSRVLVLITDAPPQTAGASLKPEAAISALETGKIDQLHIVCPHNERVPYEALQKTATGAWFDLNAAHDKDWGKRQMPELVREIVRIARKEKSSSRR